MMQENTKEQDFKLRIDRLLSQAEKEIGQIGTDIKGERGRCRAARILDMARAEVDAIDDDFFTETIYFLHETNDIYVSFYNDIGELYKRFVKNVKYIKQARFGKKKHLQTCNQVIKDYLRIFEFVKMQTENENEEEKRIKNELRRKVEKIIKEKNSSLYSF